MRDTKPSTRSGPSVRLSADAHEKLCELAADRGVTIGAMLAELVEKEHKRKPPKPGAGRRGLKKPRQSRWTREAVLDAIAARVARGAPVNSWAVQMADAGLWEGGCRIFGAWDEVLKASGVEVIDKSCGVPAKGLARLRTQRGLSQLALAKLVGTSQSRISVIERLLEHPTKMMAAALAHALQATEAEVLGSAPST